MKFCSIISKKASYNRFMKWVLICLFFLSSCSIGQPKPQGITVLEITELVPDKRSHLMTQNLVHLTKVYDLTPLMFSKKVQINAGVKAVHYPVIILNTRFAEEPPKLLAAFLHEQFHWYLIRNPKKAKAVSARLKKMYPQIKDRAHLIICYLEYEALKHFQGPKVSSLIIQDFINKDKIFPWYYREVLKNGYVFKKILKQYQLVPDQLR